MALEIQIAYLLFQLKKLMKGKRYNSNAWFQVNGFSKDYL